jgi:hypothetical protein
MTASANTYPDDLQTVYGNTEAWERLYATRLYVERTRHTLCTTIIECMRQQGQASRQAMAEFGEVQIPPTEAQLSLLDAMIDHNSEGLVKSGRIARRLNRLDDEQKGNEEDFALCEEYVAERLKGLPPPPAVVRAIGERSLSSNELWAVNRARIEVFRYVVGEQRPNVTLGPRPKEGWAQHARRVITASVHDHQLSEIMVSKRPGMTAAQYGHTPVLDRVGPPPPVDPDDSLAWWRAAVACCEVISPPEHGLAVDR